MKSIDSNIIQFTIKSQPKLNTLQGCHMGRLNLITSIITFAVLLGTASTAFTSTKSESQQRPRLSSLWLNQIIPLKDLDFVITPEQDHTKLLAAFKSARKNIKVGIFGISSVEIAEELISAVRRGVKVTVVCDKYCISTPKRQALFDQLKSSGVEMVLASSGFSITHWKMFVVDNSRAFISTMNFITRFNQMRDFGIFTSEKAIVAEVLRVFEQDIANSKDQGIKTPTLTSAHLIWSPNNSETKLIDMIDSAQSSIEIWIENMGNKNIHLALKEAVERKVKVRVLTSVCGLGMPAEQAFANLKELISYGVKVQAMPFPATTSLPYIHAKSINIDHQFIFLGSENFSYNSLLKARELGIVLKDPKIQKTMTDHYEKDWAKSIILPESAPETCDSLSMTSDDFE